MAGFMILSVPCAERQFNNDNKITYLMAKLPVEAACQQREAGRGEPCEIVFSHVSFGYENCPDILSDVSFTVGTGRTVALVGENGTGKTSIAKLLSGFLRARDGEIYIGGRPLTGCAEQYVSILPPGFQKIRYYGFLSNRFRKERLAVIFRIQGHQRFGSMLAGLPMDQVLYSLWGVNVHVCTRCGCLSMRPLGRSYVLKG